MQYCNKSLIKNNNEILQYFNKNNDILACITGHVCSQLSILGSFSTFYQNQGKILTK